MKTNEKYKVANESKKDEKFKPVDYFEFKNILKEKQIFIFLSNIFISLIIILITLPILLVNR